MPVINQRLQAANFRKAEAPQVVPKCGNCKHFTYDANDRCGARGMYFEKANKRCTLLLAKVTSGNVCDEHDFRHHDKRDV